MNNMYLIVNIFVVVGVIIKDMPIHVGNVQGWLVIHDLVKNISHVVQEYAAPHNYLLSIFCNVSIVIQKYS